MWTCLDYQKSLDVVELQLVIIQSDVIMTRGGKRSIRYRWKRCVRYLWKKESLKRKTNYYDLLFVNLNFAIKKP